MSISTQFEKSLPISIQTTLIVLLLSNINAQLSTAFAQGSLTPPGAPAPTMKSLDQIEARTPIASNTTPGNATNAFIIAKPGSYYLTGNISVSNGTGILITTNGVTLDLNGFAISSSAPSPNGSAVTDDTLQSGIYRQHIFITSGHVVSGVTNSIPVFGGSGFANGILLYGNHLHVARISVSGCLVYGIILTGDAATSVESCSVDNVGSYGIQAQNILNSIASQCGQFGIYGTVVSQCYGQCFNGPGVYGIVVSQSDGRSSSGIGLEAYATAINCQGVCDGSTYGLYCQGGNVESCNGYSQSGIGLASFNNAVNSTGASGGNSTGLFVGNGANNCGGTSAGSGNGLSTGNAQNCYGYSASGTGLSASTAIGCSGLTDTGTGLGASVAIGCHGQCNSGHGLVATIANSCYGNLLSITYKYNMP